MNEQDRKLVERYRGELVEPDDSPNYIRSVVNELLTIIDRLDKQLTEIVEAATPMLTDYMDLPARIRDKWDNERPEERLSVGIKFVHFSRLAQAMKEVKDE